MFAGPNGSGKSTIKTVVRPEILGTYVNPDEVALALATDGLDFETFGLSLDLDDLKGFFVASPFLKEHGAASLAQGLRADEDRLILPDEGELGYLASGVSDYLRRRLLVERRAFAFETVMSASDKVDFLREAQAAGYRTYLYFVATEDPRINVSRVETRVLQGGHAVPEDRIVKRYWRCLDLLADAIAYSDRAYLFDNSTDGTERLWVAEITGGTHLELKIRRVPAWFERFVMQKMAPGQP